jgi:uncharacterized protein YbaR (Trm112 family)
VLRWIKARHGATAPAPIPGIGFMLRSDVLRGERRTQPETQNMAASPERPEGTVDPKLLEILVCPVTKGPLEFDSTRQELISRSAKLAYPIRDGIPIMLPEEARKLD